MKCLLRISLWLILFQTLNFEGMFTTYEYVYNTPSIQQLISRYAKQYNVDEILMYAIIDYESSWKFSMRNSKSSSASLTGFLQGTNECVATKLGYEVEHGNLSTERQMEFLGWYLNYLKKKYKGDEKKMLRGYCSEKSYYRQIQIRKKIYKNMENRKKVKIIY